MFKVFRELIPIYFPFLTAPVKPFMHQFGRHPVKLRYLGGVFADAVIREVTQQLRRESIPPFFCFKLVPYLFLPVLRKLYSGSLPGVYQTVLPNKEDFKRLLTDKDEAWLD
ncbi:MAG: hypothetical protein WCV67_17040 [Victivallaceae bacterium]|jgi:hypothetical protein